MSNVIIRSTITKALAAWCTTKNIPLARERQAFTKPPDNGTFIEFFIIPADTIVASLDGERKRYFGNCVLNIWSKDGKGTGDAEKIADELAELFSVVPKNLLPVSVEEPPSIKRGIADNGYYILPLSFEYRAEF